MTRLFLLTVTDLVRSNAGLCTKKPRISEYDKIMFSLQSGLPNEVDFAINVCTLLSNEGRHVLHLERAVKLIDLLLAHCGVFYEGKVAATLLGENGLNADTTWLFIHSIVLNLMLQFVHVCG